MKKSYLLKVFSLFTICLSLATSVSGCKSKDKDIVVAKSFKEDLNSTNTEILRLLEEGNALLESGKFPEARATYEKAISKDKSNENTYLQIKDTYMNSKRFDDAYYIIKLAIDNNVSKDSMSKILDDIKTNFSTIQLEDTISQGSDYDLPNQTATSVDTIPNPVNIRWAQKNIDTSNPGTFNFDGYIDEYGRTVQLKLTIKETPKKDQKTSSETNNSIQEPQKKAPNDIITYASSSLGIAFDMPTSWKNNYVIKDDGTEIKVYITHERNNIDDTGLLFTISTALNKHPEYSLDSMNQEEVRTINGKQIKVGAPTEMSMNPDDPKVNTLTTMHNDLPNIFKTIRSAN